MEVAVDSCLLWPLTVLGDRMASVDSGAVLKRLSGSSTSTFISIPPLMVLYSGVLYIKGCSAATEEGEGAKKKLSQSTAKKVTKKKGDEFETPPRKGLWLVSSSSTSSLRAVTLRMRPQDL